LLLTWLPGLSMARRPNRQDRYSVVILPAHLTPAMRRAWRRIQGDVTEEMQDDVWEALRSFALRRSDGNGPPRHR
jgi:hypothetical protein